MHKLPRIILINGKIKSGKDSIGTVIKDILQASGKHVLTLKFAAPLKKMTAALINRTPEALERRELKNKPHDALVGMTPREFYTMLSAGMKLQVSANIFGDMMWAEINKHQLVETSHGFTNYDYVIIDDWRYSYEADCLQRYYQRAKGIDVALANFTRVRIQMSHGREMDVKRELEEAACLQEIKRRKLDVDDMDTDAMNLCKAYAKASVAEIITDSSETHMDEIVGSGYFDLVLPNKASGFDETKRLAAKYVKDKLLCE